MGACRMPLRLSVGLPPNREKGQPLQRLLVPMDSRTLASATGRSSWVAPYIAGLYALCCQVRPDINPGQFFRLSLQTGDTIQATCRGVTRPYGTIINPSRLIKIIATDFPRL